MLVVESAIYLINLLPNFPLRKKIYKLILDSIQQLLTKLSNESATLFRKKTDYISLISQMIIHFENQDMHQELLNLLLEFWKDPDSDVRQISINMVQFLDERNLDVVNRAFEEQGSLFHNLATVQGEEAPINIMKELVVLGNNEEYPDKERLQELLKWRISKLNNPDRQVETAEHYEDTKEAEVGDVLKPDSKEGKLVGGGSGSD